MPVNAQRSYDSIGEIDFLKLVLRKDEFKILIVKKSEEVRPRQRLFLN